MAEAAVEQTIEIYNVPKHDLDGGGLTARLAAWQAHNYPGDEGQVMVEFLDPDGGRARHVATPLQHVGTSGWVEVTASGAGPPGARQVRIKLRAVLVEGSVPNVAFDDLSLADRGGRGRRVWRSERRARGRADVSARLVC